jgi:hypothetical protein
VPVLRNALPPDRRAAEGQRPLNVGARDRQPAVETARRRRVADGARPVLVVGAFVGRRCDSLRAADRPPRGVR